MATKKVVKKMVKKAVAKKPAKKAMMSMKDVEAKGMEMVGQVKSVAKKTEKMAKKNPWALAGVAAGVGLAIGAALKVNGKKKSAGKKSAKK